MKFLGLVFFILISLGLLANAEGGTGIGPCCCKPDGVCPDTEKR